MINDPNWVFNFNMKTIEKWHDAIFGSEEELFLFDKIIRFSNDNDIRIVSSYIKLCRFIRKVKHLAL